MISAQQSEQKRLSNNEVINNLRKSGSLFSKHNLELVDVGWDDVSRAFNSSIGSNISDWSFLLKDNLTLPFIRNPNFTDKTLTILAKDVSLIVGNERPQGKLKAITFQNYLENYGKYTPGVPDNVNLSAGSDELVTIRYIAVVVPENESGSQEVVPTAYNYQTYSDDNPKNILGASFHMGVGTTTDSSRTKNVYLVKTNVPDKTEIKESNDSNDSLSQYLDYQENTWFKITNSKHESEDQKKAVSTVLGTRSSSNPARNRVQCFQIPRKQSKTKKMRSKGLVSKGIGSHTNESLVYRSLNIGNVSHGSSAGKHTKIKMNYKRDKTQNVTITFAYYFTTKDGKLNDDDVSHISSTLEKCYEDIKAKWIGSLVTGEASQTSQFVKTEAPIKLPSLTTDNIMQFNDKVTHFPKKKSDVQEFPC